MAKKAKKIDLCQGYSSDRASAKNISFFQKKHTFFLKI